MKEKLIELWYWFWGDGQTAHSKIPPYTLQLIVLIIIGVLIYEFIKWLF